MSGTSSELFPRVVLLNSQVGRAPWPAADPLVGLVGHRKKPDHRLCCFVAQALLPAAPRLISAHANLFRILDSMVRRPHRISTLFEGVRQRTVRNPVDAEMSLGAAGKSACATKTNDAL